MTPYDFSRLSANKDAERVCHAVFDKAHSKWTEQGQSTLTEGERTVLCVETFFGETLNGGLEQYLDNESGDLAEYGAAALRSVGLGQYADILAMALARCNTTQEESHAEEIATRYELPESGDEDEPLADLEHEFFGIYFADKLEFRRKMLSYILANETEFVYSE